jgi:parvulin-like peptidyl-prolyl isomerase
MRIRTLIVLVALVAGCQKAGDRNAASNTGSGSNATGSASGAAPVAKDIDSKDILGRTKTYPEVMAKHVLLGWKELAPVYQGQMDERAAKRTNAEAAALAQDLAKQLKAKPDLIDALVKQHGEDPGALKGDPYPINQDTPFVPEFKNLAMRLELNEVGIVKTQFGYHVIVRVPPPPPDPLESADILARPIPPEWAAGKSLHVRHVMIGWKDVSPPTNTKGAARTKAEADELAKKVLGLAKSGGDFAALMKEYSEDPNSSQSGRSYEMPFEAQDDPLKTLAIRLKVDEVGLVKSPFGWHVVKRVGPPPPDPLESKDILARATVTQKAKVRHILLGWDQVNAGDERAKKRDRKTLDKLVQKTIKQLTKKEKKFEDLMKELSEDPGSAASGKTYDVSPDAQLVPPFKNLSLRLKVGEIGAVKTDYGIHIIERVE